MTRPASPWEYKAVPAPSRARRFRGLRDRGEAFARTLEETIAAHAVDGWEYLRADSLPCEERSGFFRARHMEYRAVLVFRRPRAGVGAGAGLGASEPGFASPAPAAAPDPDAAAGRAFDELSRARMTRAGFAEPEAPAPRAAEPTLRPAPPPEPDRAGAPLHPDPDAPRLGPAER